MGVFDGIDIYDDYAATSLFASIQRPRGPLEPETISPVGGSEVVYSGWILTPVDGFGITGRGAPYFDTQSASPDETAQLWVNPGTGELALDTGDQMSVTSPTGTTSLPQVFCSLQLPDNTDHVLYTSPSTATSIVQHGTVCNVSSEVINVTLRLVQAGGSVDGTHVVMSNYSLLAGDTISMRDYLVGACLGPLDSIHAQASVGAGIDIVLTGLQNEL